MRSGWEEIEAEKKEGAKEMNKTVQHAAGVYLS